MVEGTNRVAEVRDINVDNYGTVQIHKDNFYKNLNNRDFTESNLEEEEEEDSKDIDEPENLPEKEKSYMKEDFNATNDIIEKTDNFSIKKQVDDEESFNILEEEEENKLEHKEETQRNFTELNENNIISGKRERKKHVQMNV